MILDQIPVCWPVPSIPTAVSIGRQGQRFRIDDYSETINRRGIRTHRPTDPHRRGIATSHPDSEKTDDPAVSREERAVRPAGIRGAVTGRTAPGAWDGFRRGWMATCS
ncbi:hypothetical protein GCM10010429_51250 [Micromonospora olivasterospora]